MQMTASRSGGCDLTGAWDAHLTFVEGPRRGETESVELRFLRPNLILHADRVRLSSGQLPRGIGEWAIDDDQLSYWFHVVLTGPDGAPEKVVWVRARGQLAPDGRTFTALGASGVYQSGSLIATHQVEVRAVRGGEQIDDRSTSRSS
jgi:hypothetical protein